MKRIAAALYLVAGLAMTLLCWQSIMTAVWGVPTHWLQYVGLVSALILTGGAVTLLVTADKGQKTCALGVAGLALLMLPASAEIVPAAGTRVDVRAYVFFAAFVGLAAGVMFYPARLRWARTLVLGLVLALAGVIGVTAWRRAQDGEYNRAVIVGFQADRSTAPVEMPVKAGPVLPPDLLTAALRAEIARTGIGGRLRWTGMVGSDSGRTRMVVIATGPIPAERPLPYPKQGTIVYVWNGARWSTVPADAPCYAGHATLRMDGMISNVTAGGGLQAFGMFHWK